MKKTAIPAVCILFLCSLLFAKKAWEKPFSEWSQKDVQGVLTDSPWADEYNRTRNLGGRGSGIGGEKEIFDKVTVRFFSALPIRRAYYRAILLMNDYNNLPKEQQTQLESRVAPLLTPAGDQIVVQAEVTSNDRELIIRIDRHLATMTTDLIKQDVTLISDRLGRIQITGYTPPSNQAPGAKFMFPREIDGQPVVAPEDKEVKFEWYLPEIGKVVIRQKVKDMEYEGRLEI